LKPALEQQNEYERKTVKQEKENILEKLEEEIKKVYQTCLKNLNTNQELKTQARTLIHLLQKHETLLANLEEKLETLQKQEIHTLKTKLYYTREILEHVLQKEKINPTKPNLEERFREENQKNLKEQNRKYFLYRWWTIWKRERETEKEQIFETLYRTADFLCEKLARKPEIQTYYRTTQKVWETAENKEQSKAVLVAAKPQELTGNHALGVGLLQMSIAETKNKSVLTIIPENLYEKLCTLSEMQTHRVEQIPFWVLNQKKLLDTALQLYSESEQITFKACLEAGKKLS